MNIVYAVDKESYNNVDHIGVKKKVEEQIEQFKKLGAIVTICQYTWKDGFAQIDIENDTDVLYFRRIEPSIKLLIKLREIKKKNRNIRILMEIPTYPFKFEMQEKISLKRRINMFIGNVFLNKYVNRIILCGYEKKKLYGIPVISFSNGVTYDKITLKKVNNQNMDDINIICVSGCFFWHGYDRAITGLAEYYANKDTARKVILHIVGEGSCLNQYIELAQKFNLLGDKVIIYGKKTGYELDEIYNLCDVAIDHLGGHRKKTYRLSTLKSKEYVAKGLPIISATLLDICNVQTKEFFYMPKDDESPLKIEEIIQFYDGIYKDKNKQMVAKNIRETFYEYCDWDFVYKPVLEYIAQ